MTSSIINRLKDCKSWDQLEKQIAILISRELELEDQIKLMNYIYGYVDTDIVRNSNNG